MSGWTFPPWKNHFYPVGLPASQELAYASRQVSSIEVNGTFYRLQTPDTFRRWYDATPDGFMFALKASRYVTHTTRLKNPAEGIARFLASGIFALKEKLGPILWQFPPSFRYDPALMDHFLSLLPHDTQQAEALTGKHARDGGMTTAGPGSHRPMTHAVEIRHESFRTPDFVEQMRAHKIALVFADTESWPMVEDVTGNVIYARLQGSATLAADGYSDKAIETIARRLSAWAGGGEPADTRRIGPPASGRTHRPVYAYFDKHVKTHAPFHARSLARVLDKSGGP